MENTYTNGLLLYGNDDYANLEDSRGYLTNDASVKKAYYLLNIYTQGYIEQDYSISFLLYFDDNICMEYSIKDGKVTNIELSLRDDTSEY